MATIAALVLALALQDPKEATADELRALSLEELMNVRVLTPGRKEQPLSRVPAAVAVLRGDDLRRLGIRELPDALRLVPGASVEQWSGGIWGVSLRGFTDRAANKLQVLQDGRSVYTPLFSGVFWDVQDTLLEDIDRIEIIRGPGASIWGANAVNGVVNIITKNARDTHGGYASAGAGVEHLLDFAEARAGHGADGFHYRAFAKYANFDEQDFESDTLPDRAHDSRFQARAGRRVDWDLSPGESAGLGAEIYDGELRSLVNGASWPQPAPRQVYVFPDQARGGFLTAWWERRFSATSDLRVQLDYTHDDRERFNVPSAVLDTFDLQVVHHVSPLEGHQVSWGAGYRIVRDEIEGSFIVSYDPERKRSDVASVFLQDDFQLVKDRLQVLVGSKFEHNDYTGFNYQPTLRLLWTPAGSHVAWASVSRAVRTPARADEESRLNLASAPGTVFAILPSDDLSPERLIAYEIGYRVRPFDSLSFDTTAFVHEYKGILAPSDPSVFTEADPPPVHTVFAFGRDNSLSGHGYGVEGIALWDVLEGWRLRATYAFLRIQLDEDDGELPTTLEPQYEGEPRHQATLWSSWTLPGSIEVDAVYRFTDRHRDPDLGSWSELDARISWRPWPAVEIGVAGKNLLHDSHRENGAATSAGFFLTEPERSAYAYLSVRF
jgi:iron complex outermembrane receptor protein